MGLEPVPVADDGGSLHCVTALCSLPSVRQERRSLSESLMLRARRRGKKEVLNISVIVGQRFWTEQLLLLLLQLLMIKLVLLTASMSNHMKCRGKYVANIKMKLSISYSINNRANVKPSMCSTCNLDEYINSLT